jgi:hypothetical protein
MFVFIILLMRATCAAHIILLNLFTVRISGDEYVMHFLLASFLILMLVPVGCKVDDGGIQDTA